MLTYELPKELIAQEPCRPRDSSRMMVLPRREGMISHRVFRDLPELLRPGDLLVLNDTRVIPARLHGCKAATGGKVELLLLQLEVERSGEKARVYRCLGQPARSLKPGTRLAFDHGSLQAEIVAWEEGERLIRFEGRGAEQALARLGEIPLPPYIGRPVRPEDAEWYQTVYAREAGAVAAPTAGLHFTGELLEKVLALGARTAFVTLHVGWGTFKPVGEREMAAGRLHPERYFIPEETVEAIRKTKKEGGRVIAVGTTVVRTLETLAGGDADGEASAAAPHDGRTRGQREGRTDLFIRPGFEFKAVDGLITNFHLPGTSLLLLVAAFAGEERVLEGYREAVRQRYRFYSYGDAMLILGEP